jgi:hypothetical protein
MTLPLIAHLASLDRRAFPGRELCKSRATWQQRSNYDARDRSLARSHRRDAQLGAHGTAVDVLHVQRRHTGLDVRGDVGAATPRA